MNTEKTELDLTRNILADGEAYNEDRLGRGFAIHPDDNKEEECVLIIGLNPAGDEKDANRERKIQSLCYVPNLDGDSGAVRTRCHYPKYFKPIYDFVLETISKDKGTIAKWAWCNIPESELCNQLGYIDGITPEQIGEIMSFYKKANGEGNITIYTGDMFYYHETDSKKLLKLISGGVNGCYYREMLTRHLQTLSDHKKTIKYVYINNALASHGLTDEYDYGASMIKIEDVPVFTGCMLSGGRAMDVFSKTRLIREIKNVL